MSGHTPGLKSNKWDHGGSGAPDGEVWVWEKTGYAPGDPDAPDSRLFSAPAKVAEQICDEHNAHADLLVQRDALLRALEDVLANSGGGAAKRCGHDFYCACSFDAARAAIAKARGGK